MLPPVPLGKVAKCCALSRKEIGMSRIAKAPITLPSGVELKVVQGAVSVKGPKGTLGLNLHPMIEIEQEDKTILIKALGGQNLAMAGTFRALVNSLVTGVSSGFEKKLSLVGVGYRAQVQGKTLSLSLGFSHPVEYVAPEGITIETPSQTEIVVRGCDKQKVGQVAAEIRAYRPPEPYKGKGVRYADEKIIRKEAKKA
jgi:large subunit ribosomal protein L6